MNLMRRAVLCRRHSRQCCNIIVLPEYPVTWPFLRGKQRSIRACEDGYRYFTRTLTPKTGFLTRSLTTLSEFRKVLLAELLGFRNKSFQMLVFYESYKRRYVYNKYKYKYKIAWKLRACGFLFTHWFVSLVRLLRIQTIRE